MKKFVPAVFCVLTILIVWVYFTNGIIPPLSKVSNSISSVNENIKTSPVKNGDGSLTYNNVDSNVIISMRQILLRAGFHVPKENEGDIAVYGTKIHFKRDNATNLTVAIKDKPWFIPSETITNRVTDFVHRCGGS